MNAWFAIPFHAARLGFEAQNAMVFRLMRMMADTNKTEAAHVADKITKPPDVVVAATNVVPVRGRGQKFVDNVDKKRVRANKRKRRNNR
jgi:hypothetical protein